MMDYKYILKVIAVSIVLAASAAPALSADQAWFRFRGFSRDGSCAAWETGGIMDGSGFPWVRFEVLNTESSQQMAEIEMVWQDFEGELPKKALQESMEHDITDTCREFGIIPGNTGNMLVYHPVTDLGVTPDTAVFCLETYSPAYNSGELTVVLTQFSSEQKPGYPDWFPPPVTPVLDIIENGEKQRLFSEEQPPEQYEMCFDYSIAAVYSNPAVLRSFLVVLHSEEPGFEGPDGRFRVVSGSY
jgi:hypothetical protein